MSVDVNRNIHKRRFWYNEQSAYSRSEGQSLASGLHAVCESTAAAMSGAAPVLPALLIHRCRCAVADEEWEWLPASLGWLPDAHDAHGGGGDGGGDQPCARVGARDKAVGRAVAAVVRGGGAES
eukprot:6188126-Pleurochrysis_carterae.AAC.9